MHSALARLTLTCLAAVLAFGVAACGPASSDAAAPTDATADGPMSIVATTGMVADLARNIAGDRAEVIGLMGPGVDPHLYKPTRSDIERLLDADIIFYNGLLLEGKMADALIRAATADRGVHAVTEAIDETFLLEPEDFEGLFDPHVWMDPAAWTEAATIVRDRLIAFDPAGEPVYTANAAAYAEQLAQLDAYAERVLASVSEQRRVLVTAHDAFNYFGRRFNYEVVGIQGLSTESEAGVRRIEELVDRLVDNNVGAVFVESTVSDRNINALIAGAAARGHPVTIGGSLFSDAMGPSGTYEGTYVGMIDHNVTTIARALGGTAPQRGMNDRLASE